MRPTPASGSTPPSQAVAADATGRATGDAYRYTVPLRGNLDVRHLTRRGRHGRTVREKARSRYATCASGTRISTDSNGTDTLPSSERSTRPSSSRRDTSVWTFE